MSEINWAALQQAAQQAAAQAYAPYSKFPVGVAILGDSGKIYTGCNVENVAYPEGTCAEAGAIAAMVAAGETRISEVCVIADSPEPVPPCGGCRQKIAEFAAQDVVRVYGSHFRASRSATFSLQGGEWTVFFFFASGLPRFFSVRLPGPEQAGKRLHRAGPRRVTEVATRLLHHPTTAVVRCA